MNAQCKKLLIDTIEMFKNVAPDKRQDKIEFIKSNLANVNNPNCFFEPAKFYVDAAKIFLRIQHKIPFINNSVYQ